MENKVYFEFGKGPVELSLEALTELKAILENQGTTDRDLPGTEVISDNFEYRIDGDYDVIVTTIR